jgi:AcrR family transcriptional regulator
MAKPVTRTRKSGGAPRRDLAERILDTALAMAEADGWAALRLRNVAAALAVPLTEVLAHYRDIDAIADAWFRRAWDAMLQAPPDGFADLPPPERLEIVILRWFDALAPHRRVTGEMLKAKMWYAHPHHWVPAVFNLSRTIHWIRDAAMLDAGGRQRQMEEIGLTALFLATLRVWLRDESEDQERTRASLRKRLGNADRLMATVWVRRTATEPDAGTTPGKD